MKQKRQVKEMLTQNKNRTDQVTAHTNYEVKQQTC